MPFTPALPWLPTALAHPSSHPSTRSHSIPSVPFAFGLCLAFLSVQAGEMAQWIQESADKPDDLSSSRGPCVVEGGADFDKLSPEVSTHAPTYIHKTYTRVHSSVKSIIEILNFVFSRMHTSLSVH